YGAIAYICNPDKTADGKYVVSNLCVSTPCGASEQFRNIRQTVGTGRSRSECQHIIQSFAPGEVTPERALLIGQELCKALFNDEYQYVLAVHCDHEHIHNHIIVNNVNFYTGKTFETEHNQGKIPERAWSKLRTISDELCRKHGLSIIENPELSKGKSHWEWELDEQNLSWKEQLKRAIDEVIKVSEDFEDFLAKCADFGILADYNPDHKIDLKFMLAEQKKRNPRAKFTRAKTLGYFYESKQIAQRIISYKYQMSHSPKAKIIRTTADRFQESKGLQNWADRENMKAASKALNEMNASNTTLEELESAAHKALAKFTVMSTPQMTMSRRIHELEEQIPAIEKYHEFVEYHKKYTSLEGKEKTKYKSDFCHELDEYNKAYKKLIELFPDGHIPKLSKLKTELENTRKEYAELSAERTAYKKEADRLSRLAQQKRDSQRTVKRYLQNEQVAKRKKGQLE
ncbi:MAG: relaxase/mobilization nuclease domain-containing protein, partial [Ruminococcus flavefaciens]